VLVLEFGGDAMTIDDFFAVGSRKITQLTAYGLALERSMGSAVVQNLASTMAA
jgi:hypothetical protein